MRYKAEAFLVASSYSCSAYLFPTVATSPKVLQLSLNPDEDVKFQWRKQWFPLAVESLTDRKTPRAITLLNTSLALWYDHKNECWNCVEDTCPHRLSPLTEGRIDAVGNIECPYHGWSFNGAGTCQNIPHAEDSLRYGTRSCVNSYPLIVRHGILWTCLEPHLHSSQSNEIPEITALEGVDDFYFQRDVPYDYSTLIENVIDISHVSFVHHRTAGNREHAGPMRSSLDHSSGITLDGFSGRVSTNREHFLQFISPSAVINTLLLPNFHYRIVAFCTPTTAGKSRLISIFSYRLDVSKTFPSRVIAWIFRRIPLWVHHLLNNAVIDDDNILLHYQERRLNDNGLERLKSYNMLTGADFFVIHWLRWLKNFGNNGPWDSQKFKLPPPLSQSELLDRFQQHTSNCTACSGALKRCQQFKQILLFASGGALFAAVPRKNPAIYVIISALSLIAREICFKIENLLLRGPYPPPRNHV